jgi:phosphatidylserine/phosphatidylglycerophosphate/cardiolipin synthase-like enzyme
VSRSLIVLPDDSASAVLAAIDGASRTLRVKMFAFSDPLLLKSVIAAKRRGVTVRVMLNAARRSGEEDNADTRKALASALIEVKDANPAFAVTHEKSMVLDDVTAFVTSFNWTTRNLFETRDYGIVTERRPEVAEIVECFEADWHHQAFVPRDTSHLIWCPGPGRDRICRFIDEARHRLFVQNERFQDMVIIERLVRAARRGVKVDVMAGPLHTLKRHKLVEGVGGLRIMDDVGIKIHRLKRIRLHGKMLLADGVAAIVGSINFAAGSFDGRRELAIEVHDHNVVKRLHRVVRHDWEHSRPLDLSDEGLLADLGERIEDSAEILGLDVRPKANPFSRQ